MRNDMVDYRCRNVSSLLQTTNTHRVLAEILFTEPTPFAVVTTLCSGRSVRLFMDLAVSAVGKVRTAWVTARVLTLLRHSLTSFFLIIMIPHFLSGFQWLLVASL